MGPYIIKTVSKTKQQMETDSIYEALKVLHSYGYTNRAIARKRQVSRTTLDCITHGHIVKKQRREVFKELMKEIKELMETSFDNHKYDKASALRKEIYRLILLDLGI